MKANETQLLEFLRNSKQFVVPIYQRNYSWESGQCQQLWDDVLHAGRHSNISGHFIGSLVHVERSLATVTAPEARLIIDGQQRLTTFTLLIAALAGYLEKYNIKEPVDGFSAKKLRHYYLINYLEAGERYYKLILSETDKDTLRFIITPESISAPTEPSLRIKQNYDLFRGLIEIHQKELEAICLGLNKLLIIDIALDRDKDNPQLIFESMNSTGLELSQADLIRNYLLMGLDSKQQTELYQKYWRPMEIAFGQEAYVTHFDPFMRHYLTAKTGEIPNIRDVYTAFKKFAVTSNLDTSRLISDLHAYADYYCAMALGAETEPQLKQALHDLRELKVDVAYPFLLDAYHDYRQQQLTVDELIRLIRLVESYVFRRAVCSIPANSLNKTFARLSRKIKKDRYLESVKASFLLMPSYRRFPTDDEFQRELKQRDLYNFRSRSYWLRRLENHGRKERIMVEDYTIEHILPQNENLSLEWQHELGPNWRQIQQKYLHTLGNLTLTGYNSQYSDCSFTYKRDEVKNAEDKNIGFKYSPLNINEGLGETIQWNEKAIQERAERLAKEACKVWKYPTLNQEIIDTYRPSTANTNQQYTINVHPHLSGGNIRILFETLRKEILNLDSCVHEEYLKLYIAYKAEANFVDIVPQAKRLRLSLNMPFGEIDDPKGLCIDVTNLGRWGNGDVEIGLSKLEEIPYVMGLIRQSFDRQMDYTQNA